MANQYNCIIRNNSDRNVRVVIRSLHGELVKDLGPNESIHTPLKADFKVLMAFDSNTEQPIGWYFMRPKADSTYSVLMD